MNQGLGRIHICRVWMGKYMSLRVDQSFKLSLKPRNNLLAYSNLYKKLKYIPMLSNIQLEKIIIFLFTVKTDITLRYTH